MTDSRYPYTYACDYIRNLGPVNHTGVILSRADASTIRTSIAEVIDMPDEQLANLLADYFLKQQDDPAYIKATTDRLLLALSVGGVY